MKGKKWLTLIGSVCLILVFAAISFMAASAPEEAKATPATHEQVELEIYSQPSGHTGYVLSFALATIINANSKWLRATCVESSANEAVFEIENHPNKAGTWVAYFSPATDYQASQGIKPFKKPNPNFRCISLCNNAFFAITTEDPNIKSLEDLAGKRVGTFFPGSAVEIALSSIMEHGYGLDETKIRKTRTGLGPQANALIDGILDAGWQVGTCFNPNTASVFDWVPNPSLEKLLSAKKTHFISVSKESLAKAREATKYPIFPITIRAKTYGQSRLEECIAYNSPASWWVMKQMPDEVVTEMCRIIYEHADEFQRYHQSGKSISKRTITSVPIPDAKWHPAAARFYASEGLTLGREK